ELLKTLPETPARTQHTLTMHIALGAALQMVEGAGAPEVERAYAPAYVLCQQVGETPELISVLFGLWRYYFAQPQLHTARELGETLLRLAQRADDPALAVIAHFTLGATWLFLGALPAARQHLEEGIARYTPDQRRALVFRMGQDPGVACRVYAARTLGLLGQRCSSHSFAPCWRKSLPTWATRKKASRRWPRPTPWWSSMRNAGGKRKSIVSGASCSCGRRGHRRRRRKPGCGGPWTSPATRRRKHWSYGPP